MRPAALILCSLALASPAAASPAVTLPIAARDQAAEAPDPGWCGETALQEALLYYGAWVPQSRINRAGKPRHPDLYWSDMPTAMKALGMRYQRWSGRGGLKAFLPWVRGQLQSGRPIVAGVKIYPTDHPRWGLDHIVTLVGVAGDGLRINTTWGHAVARSRAQLAGTGNGFSLHNRHDRQYAYAITGLRGSAGVRMTVRSETAAAVRVTIRASGLTSGQRYRLLESRTAGGPPTAAVTFAATSSQAQWQRTLSRHRAAYYRIATAD